MNNTLEIICDGDSWTFGCEIVSPEHSIKYAKDGKHVGVYDFYEENDSYRIPKTWSSFLEKKLNGVSHNISWPADDNTTILNRTISYVTSQYLAKGKPTNNLLVIVGWSSPERTSFWYDDGVINRRYRLQPNTPHFDTKQQEDFWKLYVELMWNREEFIPRYIMNVLQLQNFCEAHNIKYLQYNSFYQKPHSHPDQWNDLDINYELNTLHVGGYITTTNLNRISYDFDYKSIWDTINPINFYKKNEANNTFTSFIQKNCEIPFTGWHPSPEGHEAWSNELYKYMIENKIV
jgi:hypothetical protein